MGIVNEKMFNVGKAPSNIRALFDYGLKAKIEFGEENVYDFSLGNPSAALPKKVHDDLIKLCSEKNDFYLHSYSSSMGFIETRTAIANYMNKTYGADVSPEYIYMTCGATASLAIVFTALHDNSDDELIVVSPYFPEYKILSNMAGYKLVEIEPDYKNFSINFTDLEKKITKNTKAIVINTPNNPTGVVYKEEDIIKLSNLLKNKEKEFNTSIYIISDEPYREIIFDGLKPLYIPKYYNNTIITYSYSKSLSIPGERIGYVMIPNCVDNKEEIIVTARGSGRSLGYTCAPTTMQRLVANNQGEVCDISEYKKNRDLLYNSMKKMGYEIVYPNGAFYLFFKSLEESSIEFCERAKKFNLLIVPADGFNCKSYMRISYGVPYEMIERSLNAFRKLIDSYK